MKKHNLENIFLLIFIGAFLFFGAGTLLDHKISHEFPFGYYASDAFLHLGNAENIKSVGFYKNHPPYISAGFIDVAPLDPPVMDYLVSILSRFTGIEVYDLLPFLALFLALFGVLAFYLLIRLYNQQVAILSLPLTILLFTNKFFIGILWGHFDTYAAFAFFITAIWLFSRLDYKFILIPLSLVISAAFMTHGIEAVYIGAFAVIYVAVKYYTSGIEGSHITKIALSCLVAAILSFPFLKVFYFIYMEEPGQFGINLSVSSTTPTLLVFNWVLILIAIGFVLALTSIKKENNLGILFALFVTAISFANFLGFSKALDLRWFWPVFFSIFFGIAVYFILNFISNWKMEYSIFISLALLFTFIFFFHTPLNGTGLMDEYHWDMFKWIETNTETNSTVYYLYGNIFGQTAVLYNGKRVSYYVNQDDYINTLKEGKITRFYNSSIIIEAVGALPYSTGPFSFGSHLNKNEIDTNMDICSFEYVVFDKVSQNTVLAQYNLGIRNKFLNNTWISLVYDGPTTSIIKNSQPGKDCITGI